VTGLGHDGIEIRDPESVKSVLARLRPDIVVNTAAAHNVPRCETDEADAYAANAIGPRHLARACADIGARLVHVSTDYVFDGAKRAPYVETDAPNPLNVYGTSKLAGEYAVLANGDDHQVVRSSGLYGVRPCRAKGGNFIDTMFRLAAEKPEVKVVEDEVLTPTFTADLAAQIRVLALEGPPGLYHATNAGQCSWFEFAQQIFALGGLRTPLLSTSVQAFAAPVKRPFYSVLVDAALRAAGLEPLSDATAPAVVLLFGDAAAAPWPPPPVIVVSKRADIDSFTNAITSGVAAYFTEPADLEAVGAAARRLAAWRDAPAEIDTRLWPRRPLLLEVDVEAAGRRFRAHLVEVSGSGCRLETRDTLRRGDAVTITPHALGESTGIAIGATVTWTRMDEASRVCTAAVRFNPTSALLAPRIFGAPRPRRRQSLRTRR